MGDSAAELQDGKVVSYGFEVYDGDHIRLPCVGVDGSIISNGWWLQPHKHRDARNTINDDVDLSRPGKYVIRVAYAGYSSEPAGWVPPNAWSGLIRHPDVAFEIRQ